MGGSGNTAAKEQARKAWLAAQPPTRLPNSEISKVVRQTATRTRNTGK
jgi:hypothetical protein